MINIFFIYYAISIIVLRLFLLILININRGIKTLPPKFSSFKFSHYSYYLMMSAFVIPVLIWPLITGEDKYTIYFLCFAITGVIGETLLSFLLDTFFDKRFWIYRVDTLLKSYTSSLNFIPWGVGGLIYIGISEFFNFFPTFQELVIFWLVFILAGLILLLSIVINRFTVKNKKNLEFERVDLKSYSLAFAGFILAILITSVLFRNSLFIVVAILFGVIAWVAEYKFGKMCVHFISKRLWVYVYNAKDHGHITSLSIIPFSLAGFYFITIAFILNEINSYFITSYSEKVLIPFQYTYLVGVLAACVIWLIAFILHKEYREKLLWMSTYCIVLGVVAQYYWYTADWWAPQTITNTRVGIEDVLLSFSTGGLALFGYDMLFNKKFDSRFKKYTVKVVIQKVVEFLGLIALCMFVLYEVLEIKSYLSNIISFLIVGGYMIWQRPDIKKDMFSTGILAVVISIPVYFLINIISPGWIEITWFHENLTNIFYLGIPIEDLIWYFAFGFVLAGLYQFVFNERLKED